MLNSHPTQITRGRPLDVKPLGRNAAREIGTFSLRTKGTPPQEVTGQYVVVWEMVGTDRKLATDLWNSHEQLQAATRHAPWP